MKKFPAKLFSGIAICLFIFSGCTKTPVASFTMSDPNPSPGELVTLTNTSTNATQYTWEIDAGVYSTIESPVVVYPTSGARTIHLTAINSSKKSYDDQVITVKQEGKVIFWQDQAHFADTVDVHIGTFTRTITNFITTVSCDAAYSANFHLAPGTYAYTAAQRPPGILTWNGNITITDGGCVQVQLP